MNNSIDPAGAQNTVLNYFSEGIKESSEKIQKIITDLEYYRTGISLYMDMLQELEGEANEKLEYLSKAFDLNYILFEEKETDE